MTMLVMWLIEIYLNQLGVLKEQGEVMDQKYDRLQEEFRKYLNQPRVKVLGMYYYLFIIIIVQGSGEYPCTPCSNL